MPAHNRRAHDGRPHIPRELNHDSRRGRRGAARCVSEHGPGTDTKTRTIGAPPTPRAERAQTNTVRAEHNVLAPCAQTQHGPATAGIKRAGCAPPEARGANHGPAERNAAPPIPCWMPPLAASTARPLARPRPHRQRRRVLQQKGTHCQSTMTPTTSAQLCAPKEGPSPGTQESRLVSPRGQIKRTALKTRGQEACVTKQVGLHPF